jgi:hypothetical protein
MDQRHVLDDQRVGFHHWLAGANRRVVEATIRDDRSTGSLGAKTRERLGVATLREGRDGEQLGGGDDPLAAPTVYANLEHVAPIVALGGADASGAPSTRSMNSWNRRAGGS